MKPFIPVLLLAAALLYTPPASAWRTLTDSCTSFHALHWKLQPIPFALHTDLTEDQSWDRAADAIRQSARAWHQEDNHLQFEEQPESAADVHIVEAGQYLGFRAPRYGPWSATENVIAFQREGWPEALHGARGITFAFYHRCDGEILQTDIIMNDTYTDWHVGEMPSGCESCFDIQNMVTHELGHMIGLAHTDVPEATMNICDQPGSVADDCWCNRATFTCGRSLERDDLDGAAFLYPLGGEYAQATQPAGYPCAHVGECASQLCVPHGDEDARACSAVCEVDRDCPSGLVCISPVREANPDGKRKCWFGEGRLGDPCDEGCASGQCIGEICTETCTTFPNSCSAGFACEADSDFGGLCQTIEPPVPTSSPTGEPRVSEPEVTEELGGCQMARSTSWWMLVWLLVWLSRPSAKPMRSRSLTTLPTTTRHGESTPG